MDFLYDESGNAYSFVYNGTQYYYVRNLQGDVVKILNTSGSVVASYTYDAWGKVTSSGNVVGQYNPIRYRGYYYDTDTGFYYLQSRYYDPAIKRFISADDASLLGANGDFTSLNLYAYCGNNPVARSDDGGEAWNIVIGAVVGAVVNAVTTAVDSYKTTGSIDWHNVGVSALVGAVSGGAAATGLGPIAQATISAVASGLGTAATDLHERNKNSESSSLTWKEAGNITLRAVGSAAIGFSSSILGTAATKMPLNGLQEEGALLIFRGKTGAGCLTKTQARNLIKQGKTLINTARGISSVAGTIVTWPLSTALSVSFL